MPLSKRRNRERMKESRLHRQEVSPSGCGEAEEAVQPRVEGIRLHSTIYEKLLERQKEE